MTDSGAGYLELAISELKLDKTFMEKQVTIEVEIDNTQVGSATLSKVAKKIKTDISGRDEIMELKICMGKAGKEAEHVGMFSIRI